MCAIVWMCLLARLMGNGANRDTDRDRDEPAFLGNVSRLCGRDLERLPHSDTLKYSMAGIDPGELAEVRALMVDRAIRNKVLDRMRTDEEVAGKKYLLVAVDGVHFHTSRRELPHSTRRTHADGTVDYMLAALEAQIVCPEGVRIPWMTEFIENPPGGDYDKQDCELAAAKRLLARLKNRHPRLPVLLLLDGLYLCEAIVDLVRKNGWGLSVTVNDKTPAFLAEAERRMAADPRNRIEDKDPVDGRGRTVAWTNHVKHVFGQTEADLNVVKMTKVGANGKTGKSVYATTIFLKKRRVVQVLDRICRARWQAEEAFKVQKCHGLGLEKAFGTTGHAGVNYYHIVQIAHIILELILHSSLFRRLQRHQNPEVVRNTICRRMLEWYGTIKNVLAKFKCYLLMRPLSDMDIREWRLEFNTS